MISTERPRRLLLDLDGTLVDSLSGIEYSLRAALAQHAPDRLMPGLRPYIGPPIGSIVEALFPDLSVAVRQAVVAAFRRHYDEVGYRHSEPYEDVSDMLERLHARGHAMYVVTNKRAAPTTAILENLNWIRWFEEVVTLDGGRERYTRKIDAAMALVEGRGPQFRRALVVGDSAEDFATAQALGLRFVYARYGYGRDVSADLTIDRFRDLESMLLRA